MRSKIQDFGVLGKSFVVNCLACRLRGTRMRLSRSGNTDARSCSFDERREVNEKAARSAAFSGWMLLSVSQSIVAATELLPVTLAGERRFHAALFSRRNVEGVALDFADDVLLLNLAFEPAKRALERFVIAQSDFCQFVFTCLSTSWNVSPVKSEPIE